MVRKSNESASPPNSNLVNGKVAEEARTLHQASSNTPGSGKQLIILYHLLLYVPQTVGPLVEVVFGSILILSTKAHEANGHLFFPLKMLVSLFQAISLLNR